MVSQYLPLTSTPPDRVSKRSATLLLGDFKNFLIPPRKYRNTPMTPENLIQESRIDIGMTLWMTSWAFVSWFLVAGMTHLNALSLE